MKSFGGRLGWSDSRKVVRKERRESRFEAGGGERKGRKIRKKRSGSEGRRMGNKGRTKCLKKR